MDSGGNHWAPTNTSDAAALAALAAELYVPAMGSNGTRHGLNDPPFGWGAGDPCADRWLGVACPPVRASQPPQSL